jgi:hypothetical protein
MVNVSTVVLSSSSAKSLAQAAGQSSLTLRPSDPAILSATQGPALCLGLWTSSHAFVKLKSLQASTQTHSVWQLSSGEVMALASSSSRLARELYCLCFDNVYGVDCPFQISNK